MSDKKVVDPKRPWVVLTAQDIPPPKITPDAASKLPSSPDVTRWNPPNITQPSLMGGPQTGAVAQPPPVTQPTPPPPTDIKRVQTVKPAQ